MLKTLSCFLCMVCASLFLQARPACIVKEESIFQNAPFAACHASTLTQTQSGTLLCAWFAGTDEGEPDVAIWLSSLSEQAWTSPKKIAEAPGMPCWNPVLFTMPSQEILLFYKAGPTPQQWSSFLKRSHDDGVHWSKSTSLPAGVIGPVKNKPLLLPNGTLLCGSSIESWRRWGCWIDITSDAGRSWVKSGPINLETELFGIIQPTLFFGKNGSIQLLTRSLHIGSICSAESFDEGKTWSPVKKTALPNPNSAIDAVNLKDGRIALVYNHSTQHRYPLNLAVSKDDGVTWDMVLTLTPV